MAETTYFKKIVLTTKVRLSNGRQIDWVPAGWNVGVMETSDPALISELSQFAKDGRGGVQVIDKATFDDLKKNSGSKSPKQEWSPGVTGTALVMPTASPKAESEKPSKSAVAAKPVRAEKPATATGVFPAEK